MVSYMLLIANLFIQYLLNEKPGPKCTLSHSCGHQCKLHSMIKGLTLTNIICNALNPDYTSTQAADDLSKPINEATLMQIQEETDSP
jgi:hypothetical protein